MGSPGGRSGRIGPAPIIAVASAALLLTLLTLVRARWSPLLSFDRAAIVDLTDHTREHSAYQAGMTAVSQAMHSHWSVLYAVLIAAGLCLVKRVAEAGWLVFTVASGNLVNPLVKQLVDRRRPELAAPIESFSGLSFPAGHAASAMLICSALLVLVWPSGNRGVRGIAVVVAIVIVLLSGGSRLVLGAHYPSDIVGGYLLGIAWVAACRPLLGWFRKRLLGVDRR